MASTYEAQIEEMAVEERLKAKTESESVAEKDDATKIL
jgi:hypothetical protein